MIKFPIYPVGKPHTFNNRLENSGFQDFSFPTFCTAEYVGGVLGRPVTICPFTNLLGLLAPKIIHPETHRFGTSHHPTPPILSAHRGKNVRIQTTA